MAQRLVNGKLYDIVLLGDPVTGEPSAGGGGGGGSSTTLETTQVQVRNAVQALAVDVGDQADAAATTDNGSFSIISYIKRAMANWTTLLARTPALVNGATPVTNVDDFTLTGPASQSAINTDLLTGTVSGWYDAAAYQGSSIQIIASAGISAGAIIFECTNSLSAAAVPIQAYEVSSVNSNAVVAAVTIAASTVRMWSVPVRARYIRVRISTAFVGGTVQAVASLSQRAATYPVINVQQATAANLNVTTQATAGTAAFGAAASGNPLAIAGIAATAQATARTAGQMVAHLLSKVGHTVIMQNQIRELRDTAAQVVLTSATETTIVAAVAATFNDLEGLIIQSTATFTGTPTAVRVDIRETTAGTPRLSIPIPLTPGASIPPISLPAPLKQATVNTNWTAQVVFVGGTSPAISAGDIRITAQTVRQI